MSQISLQRNVSVLFKSSAYTVELRRNAGWKRRVLNYEAKKDIVFQYAGKKAHRSDRIYVWGCSATGALGKIFVVLCTCLLGFDFLLYCLCSLVMLICTFAAVQQ